MDFLLTSEEAGVTKPDVRIFEKALKIADIDRKRAVFIGDSWSVDIVGAHQAGIRSVWLNRFSEPCPDRDLTTELLAFSPLDRALKALGPI